MGISEPQNKNGTRMTQDEAPRMTQDKAKEIKSGFDLSLVLSCVIRGL